MTAVLAELRSGQKRSHWMWFVFPQIYGLGHSPTAQHYAIKSIEEARQYLKHTGSRRQTSGVHGGGFGCRRAFCFGNFRLS